MSRQATDQLYIELDYYYPEEYFVYTAEAAAVASAESTVSCSVDKVKESTATLTSAFTQQSTEDKLKLADAVLTSEFTQQSTEDKLVGVLSDLTVQATQSAVVGKIIQFQSEPFSLFTIGVSAFITTSASTDITATVTMLTVGEIVKTANITLDTIVSLSLQAARLPGIIQNLSAATTMATTATEYESYISSSPTPLYALGQALISTTQTHFGTHSLFLPDGSAGAESASLHTKFNINSSTDFGIAFWYYPTANAAGTYDDIVSHYNATVGSGWAVQRTSTRGIRFLITDGGVGESDETGATVLTLNSWNWVVVTRDSGTLRIYINGTQQAIDTTHTADGGTGSKYFRIGNISTNGSSIGYLDGLRINIGNVISATTPTEDTLYAVAGDKILLNWNDSSLGNWWDYSLSELITGSAALTSTATQSTSAEKLIGIIQSLNSTATLTASGETVATADAAVTATTSVACSITKLTGFSSQLSAESTLTASALDLDLASANLSATTSVTATASVIKRITRNLASVATQSIVARRTRSTGVALNCQGFLVAVALDLDLASANLSTTATMSVAASKTARAVSTQAIAFTQTLQALRIKQLTSSLASAFSLSCAETRLKDVFISGTLGQVYFNNTISSSNDYGADEGDKFIRLAGSSYGSPSGGEPTLFAIAFWASGKGHIWSNALELSSIDDINIQLTDNDEFIYSYGTLTRTWSGIDTLANNHYIMYSDKLYVNGQDQGAPTESGSGTPKMYRNYSRYLALSGNEGVGGNLLAGMRGFVGAVGQYVMWAGPSNVGQSAYVPDFTQSSERQKLYNNGYVDIGSDGTDTGLIRPWDYFKLDNYAGTLQRGLAYSGSAEWKILGPTYIAQQDTYRYVYSYTATEQDDVGPFGAVSTLTVSPISVLIVAANLNTSATVTADVKKLVGIIHDFATTASLTASVNRLRNTSADLQVTGSELVIAVKTGRTLIDCGVTATMTTQARVERVATASLNTTSTISCIAQATKSAQANTTSQFTTVAVNGRLRNNATVASTAVTVASVVRKVASGGAQLQTTTTLTGSPFTTHNGQASLTSNVQLTANAIASYIAISNMSVTATMTVSVTKITRFTANLSAFDFMLVIGTKIFIDPYYQLVVPRELSVKKIQQETGILTLDAENRLNTVQAENATLTVPREISTWHIPYAPQVGARRVK